MKVITIIVTRNKSCHVKTLHTLLILNMQMAQKQEHNMLAFVEDDPFKISSLITSSLPNYDRLIFIDYGVGMLSHDDINTVSQSFEPGYHCMVYPGITRDINWDMVKDKLTNKIEEPIAQMGSGFDTEVSTKIKGYLYKVSSTNPKCFVLDCKGILKSMKDKKNGLIIPSKREEMFNRFIQRGVKICAHTKAKLTIFYQYESLGNLSRSFGVSQRT